MSRKLILLLCSLIAIETIYASGISVNDVSLENFNESEGWVHVQCDISWNHSWRLDTGPSNWDAAWVFVKYRANGGPWLHATLDPTNTDVWSSIAVFDVSSDGKGAFFYKSDVGSGNTIIDNAQLAWNYQTDGVTINDVIEVKVFAIEMVYVPQGAFYIGNGGSGPETDAFKKGNTAYSEYLVASEAEIAIGNTSFSQLNYDNNSSYAGDGLGPVPDAFPKGYNAFYCMKYEISEEQYAAFFNTLNIEQQEDRDITNNYGKDTDDEVDGNTIAWDGPGNEMTTLTPDRACSFLSGTDVTGYLHWAALRPMTELEYEKVARGPGTPVAGVYAWGTEFILDTPYNLWSPDTGLEYISSGSAANLGRANYNLTNTLYPRPVRCGMFSYGTTGTREKAGASYYGVMELSGNLAERVISVGSPNERGYQGIHGNGIIGDYGPGTFVNLLIYAIRGGSWIDDANLLLIADRTRGGGFGGGVNVRQNYIGGRGVRTAD
ncbi:SUMF1/EgtB/PvdO family nonheme iron enzyme [uncultured Psychroserpens sp.]|uniref:SUMF1/EgtB/PvdO family nonheme iron enzyme n=1 Tax=uncultured Psychroserpens sp. TaxID=255436 RepID=UPI0026274B2E|nr:SUMF1/EgtB/PvdO family nonheme iron enzyme [uncultured Psychroserpens sp.]